MVLLSCDSIPEYIDDSCEDEDMFIQIPTTINANTTNLFSAVSHLCYGKHNKLDIVEFCGGAGRISQVAFQRGL